MNLPWKLHNGLPIDQEASPATWGPISVFTSATAHSRALWSSRSIRTIFVRLSRRPPAVRMIRQRYRHRCGDMSAGRRWRCEFAGPQRRPGFVRRRDGGPQPR